MYILYCINEEVVVYLKATINCGYKFGGLMDLAGIYFYRFLAIKKPVVRQVSRHQALKPNTDVDTSESETWWAYPANTCAANVWVE